MLAANIQPKPQVPITNFHQGTPPYCSGDAADNFETTLILLKLCKLGT